MRMWARARTLSRSHTLSQTTHTPRCAARHGPTRHPDHTQRAHKKSSLYAATATTYKQNQSSPVQTRPDRPLQPLPPSQPTEQPNINMGEDQNTEKRALRISTRRQKSLARALALVRVRLARAYSHQFFALPSCCSLRGQTVAQITCYSLTGFQSVRRFY